MLVRMKSHLNLRCGKDIAFWCACLLAFFGFLRKSTLLPKNASSPGIDCVLHSDLRMPTSTEVALYIRKTKTIQYGQRILTVPYVSSPYGCPLCPVLAVKSLLRSSTYEPDKPLFMYNKGQVLKWWAHTTFSNRLAEVIEESGYDQVIFLSFVSSWRG